MGAATEGQLMPSLPSELVFLLPVWLMTDGKHRAERH